MGKFIKNNPEAGCLMGSLRSVGYSFESAIADIIDNSISAECKEVHVFFTMNPASCYVAILDDGYGMSKAELFRAMRYGSVSCEESRKETDLGRFGVGLKSASLSQCRILTVISKKGQRISGYRWNYNIIRNQSDWLLEELDNNDISDMPHIENLEKQSCGTLVIWQDFDVLSKSNNGLVYSTLMECKTRLISHIGLIFHRYINPTNKAEKVVMFVNKHKVEALDPFLEKHPKTTLRKEIDIVVKDKDEIERHITAQPFILPFISDLTDKDKEKLGGIENLRVKQGFYIYRNRRLIIWGTWFGMKRNELTKNARVRVDIPNSLDDIWSLDIIKQKASIPSSVLHQLKRAIEEAMDISIRQQTHRGRRKNIDSNINYIWNRLEGRDENHFFYEINRETELFKYVKSHISDEAFNYVEMLIDEIEKGIPFQQMYIDTANNCIQEQEDPNRIEEIKLRADLLIKQYTEMGLTAKDVIDNIILREETFHAIINLKEDLYNQYSIQ